ncbi:hypothetical protein DE146DRAFT_737068 [Phaeosphaeria sp. MPI-PUGE-AT-0046c]|nr:hypothetical protein DE146DRAFT_737068 [Phaeosphaeria sp. MPI-PUGE-AT-0046c]
MAGFHENEQNDKPLGNQVKQATVPHVSRVSLTAIHHTYDIVPIDITPSPLTLEKNEDRHRASFRVIRARMLLINCSVLQNMICAIDISLRDESDHKEKRQRIEECKRKKTQYYDRMLDMAGTASELALREKSQELRVRSEYWLGRSDGGSHDYRAAIEHFKIAKNLETVENSSSDGGVPLRRQLLRNERADIDDLMSYCTKRMEKRVQKDDKLFKHAIKESEKRGIPVELCMDRNSSSSLVWEPDLEFRIEETKTLSATQQNSGSQTPRSVTWEPWTLDSSKAGTSPAIEKRALVWAGRSATPSAQCDKGHAQTSPAELHRYKPLSKQSQRRTSSHRHSLTLRRRSTQASVGSVTSINSDLSSPRVSRLEDELMGSNWLGDDTPSDLEEEDDAIEGINYN